VHPADPLERHLTDMSETRARTYALVDGIAEDDLVRVHSPLMSPLAWDLGHIAAFEDLWLVHRFGERPMVREDLAMVYDAFETPRAARGELPFLGPREARSYLEEVRAQAVALAREHGIGDGRLHEMVLRHEHQHCETMMQTIQLAHLDPHPDEPDPAPSPLPGPPATGLEFVAIPAGACSIGAAADGFAYDNERPRHEAQLGDFEIATSPVTNGAYLEFVLGGGYQRREWWCPEGWEWRQEQRVEQPGGWAEDLAHEWRLGRLARLDPACPVVHVSWYEADAFARAHGARLPTELEWEKAATCDPGGAVRPYPWGDESPIPGVHGNLDQRERGPVPAATHTAGASAYGVDDLIGQVWEWTASTFAGYAGFVAHPYREYSEVFFGQRYRVLRGASWATRAHVATATFRNWDFPERRQIFAGIRVAR
jgi:iron(II)-dependent oxidoreductase